MTPDMIFRTFGDRPFENFEVSKVTSFGDDAGDDFINFWRSTFLRIWDQLSTSKTERRRPDDVVENKVERRIVFFLWKWIHLRPRIRISLLENNNIEKITSSTERHRLDFNVDGWSQNFWKVDHLKFPKSSPRSSPNNLFSETSTFLKSRPPKVPKVNSEIVVERPVFRDLKILKKFIPTGSTSKP